MDTPITPAPMMTTSTALGIGSAKVMGECSLNIYCKTHSILLHPTILGLQYRQIYRLLSTRIKLVLLGGKFFGVHT